MVRYQLFMNYELIHKLPSINEIQNWAYCANGPSQQHTYQTPWLQHHDIASQCFWCALLRMAERVAQCRLHSTLPSTLNTHRQPCTGSTHHRRQIPPTHVINLITMISIYLNMCILHSAGNILCSAVIASFNVHTNYRWPEKVYHENWKQKLYTFVHEAVQYAAAR